MLLQFTTHRSAAHPPVQAAGQLAGVEEVPIGHDGFVAPPSTGHVGIRPELELLLLDDAALEELLLLDEALLELELLLLDEALLELELLLLDEALLELELLLLDEAPPKPDELVELVELELDDAPPVELDEALLELELLLLLLEDVLLEAAPPAPPEPLEEEAEDAPLRSAVVAFELHDAARSHAAGTRSQTEERAYGAIATV